MEVYKHVSKLALIIIYFIILMVIMSFIGTLLTVPSTFANILGILVIILVIFGSVWYFKMISKIDKEEQSN